MTINAGTSVHNVRPAADGRRYAGQPDGTSGPPPSAITAVIEAFGWGQSAGPAGSIIGPPPLLVHFNGLRTIGESGLDTFRQYGYHFDFGYASGTTTYTTTGLLRIRQVGGPLAAHCYLTPGTYTASLRVETPSSLTSDSTVIVVVQDPDAVYSSSFTVCLFNGGEQSGGPAGCSYHDASTAWPTFAANKRYLLQAGDTFTNAGSIAVNQDGILLGKYKTGANPRINGNITVAGSLMGSAHYIVDKFIASHLDGVTVSGARVFGTVLQARDVLFYDCRGHQGFVAGSNATSRWNTRVADGTSDSWHLASKGFGVVDCDVDFSNKGPAGTTEYCIFPHFVRNMAVMGCTLDKGGEANGNEHVLRSDTCEKEFVAHNILKRPYQPKHHFTFRGKGRKAYDDTILAMTEAGEIKGEARYCVFADNIVALAGESVSWKISISPTSANSNEAISDVIIERNIFASSAGTSSRKDIAVGGMRITIRDNTLVDGELRRPDASLGAGGIGDNPDFTGPYYFQSKAPVGDDEFTADSAILPTKAGT